MAMGRVWTKSPSLRTTPGKKKKEKPGCNSQALNHTKLPTNGWRAETGSHQPREGLHVTGVEASKVMQETFKFQFPGAVTVINLELRLSTHVSSHAHPEAGVVETEPSALKPSQLITDREQFFSLIWPRESISRVQASIRVFAGQEQQRATADCDGYVLVPLFRLLGRVAMVGRHVFVSLDHLMGGTYVHSSQ